MPLPSRSTSVIARPKRASVADQHHRAGERAGGDVERRRSTRGRPPDVDRRADRDLRAAPSSGCDDHGAVQAIAVSRSDGNSSGQGSAAPVDFVRAGRSPAGRRRRRAACRSTTARRSRAPAPPPMLPGGDADAESGSLTSRPRSPDTACSRTGCPAPSPARRRRSSVGAPSSTCRVARHRGDRARSGRRPATSTRCR